MIEQHGLDSIDNKIFGEVFNRYQRQSADAHSRSESISNRSELTTIHGTPSAPAPRTPLELYQHSTGSSAHAIKRITAENQAAHQSQFAALID